MPPPRNIIIEGNAEAGFRATVSGLPGYSSFGPTVDDAEEEMRDMLRQDRERVGVVQVEVSP